MPRTGRADKQHALGNSAAESREPARFAKELDDLADLVLRFVHAGDIVEGDGRLLGRGAPRVAFHRRQPPVPKAIDRDTQQRQKRQGQEERAKAVGRWCRRALHVYLNAARDQVVQERRAGSHVALWGGRPHALAVLERGVECISGELHVTDLVGADGAQEFGERHLPRHGLGPTHRNEQNGGGEEQAGADEHGGTTLSG